MGEAARFCPNCGQQVGGGVAPAYQLPPPAPRQTPLDYTMQGDNLQIARVRLKVGQEIYAEAGKMVYKSPNISWETRMSGDSIGQKIWGAIKRKLMGESLFLTYFRAVADGEVGFAGTYPGKIQAYDLAPG